MNVIGVPRGIRRRLRCRFSRRTTCTVLQPQSMSWYNPSTRSPLRRRPEGGREEQLAKQKNPHRSTLSSTCSHQRTKGGRVDEVGGGCVPFYRLTQTVCGRRAPKILRFYSHCISVNDCFVLLKEELVWQMNEKHVQTSNGCSCSAQLLKQ